MSRRGPAACLSFLTLTALAACGDGVDQPNPLTEKGRAPVAIVPATPAPAQTAGLDRAAVDAAAFKAEAAVSQDRTPAVLRAQVLLDRARFSPGVIDGRPGENVRQAIAAYEEANGLQVDGVLDEAVFQKLAAADPRPVLAEYVIAPADVAGPFIAAVPEEVEAQASLPALSYTGPLELLAEKFHMTEDLLQSLNPGVDFTKAGTRIVVAERGADKLDAQVARIDVLKKERAVRAYDGAGKLVAFYPATIGSSDLPSPEGELKVRTVAPEPSYTFDPERLNFGTAKTKLKVPAGPNNPVGSVWIDLSKDTYGIHGSDKPHEIGKTMSHGCVRLTNWDAEELASAVKAGVTVKFLES